MSVPVSGGYQRGRVIIRPGIHVRTFRDQQMHQIHEPFRTRPKQRCPVSLRCLTVYTTVFVAQKNVPSLKLISVSDRFDELPSHSQSEEEEEYKYNNKNG